MGHEQHAEVIAMFQAITGCANAVCARYLEPRGWDLEQALSAYFDSSK